MLVTANSVIEVVIAQFTATVASSTTLSSGGLWFDEIPEDKDLDNGPFVALVDVKDRGPLWTTEAGYEEDTAFTFEMYAVSLPLLVSLLAQIRTAFDLPGSEAAKVFQVLNANVVGCQRQETTYHHVGERTATNQKVYMVRVSYLFRASFVLGVPQNG